MNRLLRLGAALALAGAAGIASAASYTGLYVFGDSLSDSGNIAALLGADASQVVTGNGYIPSRPYASGQFTNGNVWVQSFAAAIGLAPYAAPSLGGGGNFAFGGARTATDGADLPPSLNTQTTQFVNANGGVVSSTALYVVEGGGNDARDALAAAATAAAQSQDPSTVIGVAANAYAQATASIVDRLQAAGAKRIIVWEVPNLALAPGVVAQGAGASFLGGLVSQAMNNALAARLAGEAGVSIFDVAGLQTKYSANPSAYGLTNVTDACGAAVTCTDGYLYWDAIHPTATGHALLAQAMVATVAVPEPTTWAMFAAGLLLIGWRAPARRRARAAAQAAR